MIVHNNMNLNWKPKLFISTKQFFPNHGPHTTSGLDQSQVARGNLQILPLKMKNLKSLN